METLIAGGPAVAFLKLCYHANRPPLLEGGHGIGKSELMRQVATELGIGFLSRDLSLMEPPDLVGLPKMDGHTTKYMPPDFLPRDGKGILIFEELNRCEKYMRSPCLELLTNRRLNDYKLPDGWLPAACINPADTQEHYEVDDLDPALLSRFVRARLVPDQQEWLHWARNNAIHPAVIRYVENDSTVFSENPDSHPRSWKYVSDLVKAAEETSTDLGTLRKTIVGSVGSERGVAFQSMLNHSECPLDAKTILGGYKPCRHQVQRWIKSGKLDLVTMTLLALKKYLQLEQDFAAVQSNSEEWNNLATFLYDLPGDLIKDARQFFADREYSFPRAPRNRRRP